MTPYWTRAIRLAGFRKAVGLPAFTSKHRDLSASWVTCACGRQDPRIPRNSGWPEDITLLQLGLDFLNAVRDNDVDSARRVLGEIELRAAEVIAEEGR